MQDLCAHVAINNSCRRRVQPCEDLLFNGDIKAMEIDQFAQRHLVQVWSHFIIDSKQLLNGPREGIVLCEVSMMPVENGASGTGTMTVWHLKCMMVVNVSLLEAAKYGCSSMMIK